MSLCVGLHVCNIMNEPMNELDLIEFNAPTVKYLVRIATLIFHVQSISSRIELTDSLGARKTSTKRVFFMLSALAIWLQKIS